MFLVDVEIMASGTITTTSHILRDRFKTKDTDKKLAIEKIMGLIIKDNGTFYKPMAVKIKDTKINENEMKFVFIDGGIKVTFNFTDLIDIKLA